jgi:hypothetical protein
MPDGLESRRLVMEVMRAIDGGKLTIVFFAGFAANTKRLNAECAGRNAGRTVRGPWDDVEGVSVV